MNNKKGFKISLSGDNEFIIFSFLSIVLFVTALFSRHTVDESSLSNFVNYIKSYVIQSSQFQCNYCLTCMLWRAISPYIYMCVSCAFRDYVT